MSQTNKIKTDKYTREWFAQILSDRLKAEKGTFKNVTIHRVKSRIQIGYQSWRPRFVIRIPSDLSTDLNLPSLLYAKDDVREEEFAAHSKIWNLFRKGQSYFFMPRPVCFFKHPGTDRGIVISEAIKGYNLNDLLYLTLIPCVGFFISNKAHKLFFRAGQGIGEYSCKKELVRGTLKDNICLAHEAITLMREFRAEDRKAVEKFLSQLPEELLNSKTTLAIDYLPRNLMYSGQGLFFVDFDPIGYRHPSYLEERFVHEIMNKSRYPATKISNLKDLTKSFRNGIDSVKQEKDDTDERKTLQIFGKLLYLRELERSRKEYWVNGADRFWIKYIRKLVNDLMISLNDEFAGLSRS